MPDQPGLGYGLGWITKSDDHGYRVVYHTGGMPGVSTAFVLFPSEDLAAVVLTNSYAGITPKMVEAVVDCVLPKYAEAARNDKEEKPPKPGPFTATPELLGQWKGEVRTWERNLPLLIGFQQDGDIHIKLGDELETLVNDSAFKNGILEGRFARTMPTPDARRYRHSVLLHLRLRGDKLDGQVIAETPDESVHFALSSFAELPKDTAAKSASPVH